MNKSRFPFGWRSIVLLIAFAALAACGGHGLKHDLSPAPDVPGSFDVTLLADKDGQFDYDGAPLTAEDLKSALRYRQEENQPVANVLLKRGEKQKVKDGHVVTLGKIAAELGIHAFVDEGGQITAIRTATKAK